MTWLFNLFNKDANYWWKRGYEDGKRACKRTHNTKLEPGSKEELIAQIVKLRQKCSQMKKDRAAFHKAQQGIKIESNFKTLPKGYKDRRTYSRIKGVCIYCGLDATQIDHMTPRSRGGSDEPDNKALACGICNNEKGNMTYNEYMTWRKYHRP